MHMSRHKTEMSMPYKESGHIAPLACSPISRCTSHIAPLACSPISRSMWGTYRLVANKIAISSAISLQDPRASDMMYRLLTCRDLQEISRQMISNGIPPMPAQAWTYLLDTSSLGVAPDLDLAFLPAAVADVGSF